MKSTRLLFAGCLLAVLAVAAAVRLPRLAARPMHCDEANQAVRAGILWKTGVYRYDVADHHGPTLYWFSLPVLALSGAEDFAHTDEAVFRIVPVVFGLGLIALVLVVAGALGRGAAIGAALLAAVSPAMVYYSRYYIHETLLVFFTFAAIASAWRYVRARSVAWGLAAGASLGLMYATKETWILAAAAMAAGAVLTAAWTWWRDGARPRLREYFHPAGLAAAVAAACLVAGAFYSSFGTNWRGPWDSIRAYANYWRRGSENGIHAQPWYFYVERLLAYRPCRGFFWTEGLIGGLALAGVIVALARRVHGDCPDFRRHWQSQWHTTTPGVVPDGENGTVPFGPAPVAPNSGGAESPVFWRFLAFYTLVLAVLYSVIPYKTPWCLLSFLHGMTLLAGLGAWAIIRRAPGLPAKLCVAAILAGGVGHLGWECYWLNFRIPADQQRNPWAYAHTSSDMLNLAACMERLAQVSPEGHGMVIHVVTPENYWPLPWYLRQFNEKHVGYWQDPATWRDEVRQGPPPSVILLTPEVQADVDAGLLAAYNKQPTYGLRPGVRWLVYVREDLWQAMLRACGATR